MGDVSSTALARQPPRVPTRAGSMTPRATRAEGLGHGEPRSCHTPCVRSDDVRSSLAEPTRGTRDRTDPAHRRITQVRAWALARGATADSECLAVLTSVKAARDGCADFDRWTAVDVDELLWFD